MLFFGTVGMAILSGNVSVVAAAATIYVDDDNTGGPWNGTPAYPYQYIQDGVNVASDGDTVYVRDGTYSENVVSNKSITLRGDLKTVIDGMNGSYGINITVNNVIVEGFNITNSYYGIYTKASGFSVLSNIFWYDNYGFYWKIDESGLAEDYTVYDGTVKNNEFYMNSNNDAVYVYVSLDYNYTGFYDVEIGDITICNNTFYMEGTTADGIDVGVFPKFLNLFGGNVSVGTVNMSENRIYGGSNGIYFEGYPEYLKDVRINVGDLMINNNVLVNQSSYGIIVDYYDATHWDGDTTGTYGDLIIRGNTIRSEYSPDGICVYDIGYWEDFTGNASLEVGNVFIEGNEIDVGGDGIYFIGYDAGYDMYDNSSLTVGSILVNNNTINSGDDGMYVYIKYFGSNMYGSSSFAIGDIQFNDNKINSGDDGIYVDSFYGVGYYMYDNSSFTMGNIEFSGNSINSTYEGIFIYNIEYVGYEMDGTSSFVMVDFLVNDNIINSGDDGIFLNTSYNKRFGYNVHGNASFTMGNIEFSSNTISNSTAGIYLTDLENATIRKNLIPNCSYGIYLVNSNNNLIYHNNFINNTVQANVTAGYANTWDNDYPSGGNYWSDYNGTDLFSGLYQNITGSDFRGDTPYVIDSNNTDRYPLMIHDETEPPTISILSPENKTYTTEDVPLTFTVSESTSWMGYSLDGQANTPITGNTTLTGLSEGTHSITVYAIDTAGKTGASEIIYFTIDTVPPSISILSPENKTYDTTDIPLTFTVDETVSWMAYSLNGQANVTITGNTTLTGLSEASHSIIVYATDTAGNTGASEIFYITIETKKAEPFPRLMVAVIVIIGVAGAVVFVYFTKFKK